MLAFYPAKCQALCLASRPSSMATEASAFSFQTRLHLPPPTRPRPRLPAVLALPELLAPAPGRRLLGLWALHRARVVNRNSAGCAFQGCASSLTAAFKDAQLIILTNLRADCVSPFCLGIRLSRPRCWAPGSLRGWFRQGLPDQASCRTCRAMRFRNLLFRVGLAHPIIRLPTDRPVSSNPARSVEDILAE